MTKKLGDQGRLERDDTAREDSGTGAANALAISDQTTVTVNDLNTGEVLSTHTIDPDRSYWRNQQKSPGRWPRRNP